MLLMGDQMPEQPIASTHTDDLSPLARQILSLDTENSYRRLVVHGNGNEQAKKSSPPPPQTSFSQPSSAAKTTPTPCSPASGSGTTGWINLTPSPNRSTPKLAASGTPSCTAAK